jgi:hypothetical protein
VSASKPYLAVGANYRDEGPYLREWIEFHLLVGVEKFFLNDNLSVDDHLEVLAPYIDEGIVVVHDQPHLAIGYRELLKTHRHDARWIAFIDSDEFLFSPTGQKLPELLAEYEQWPAVGVNRLTFGTNGHVSKPEGLAIENYTRRSTEASSIKSIVDPERTRRIINPHAFGYADDAHAVDENKEPIEGWFTKSFTASRLRINHYWTRSLEECDAKRWRTRGTNPPQPWRKPSPEEHERLNEVEDTTIFMYAPALKEGIARREGAARTS